MKMTLKDLLSHFPDETWVDLSTPLWRKCGELQKIKSETADAILDLSVDKWYMDSDCTLIIDM